jgi:hypothetical protein
MATAKLKLKRKPRLLVLHSVLYSERTLCVFLFLIFKIFLLSVV